MSPSVLVVDNDRNLCQVMAKALEARGYEVAMEFDGEQALALVEEAPPDLALIDLMLPRRDGFAVLESIRQLPEPACATPVVLLSGCSPTPEYTRRSEDLCAVALLTKPVPLEKLVEVVGDQLGEAKRSARAARAGGKATRRAGKQQLSGRLERFSFPALLHHLHGLRATGVLHLAVGKKRKWVQLRDGYPTAVRSNLMNECLGNFLARSGKISPAVMQESVRRMKSGQLQGEILVAMEVLSEEEVSQALREQAEGKLFEIFSWKAGAFRFEFGASLQKASGIARRSPANLILQGVRKRTPIERIDKWMQAQENRLVARGEEPFYRFQEVDLDPQQRRWVEELDGSRRLADFRNADEALRRTLYGLVRTGIVELRGGEPKRRARKAAGPAVPVVEAPPGPDPGPEEESKRAELAAMAERFAAQTCFEILEVEETASEDEIRAAYERLAERAHPDRVNASSDAVKHLATEVFRHVEFAYEVLTDPKRRQEYVLDRKRADREAAKREGAKRALEAEKEFQRGEAALRDRDYEIALRRFGKALQLYPEEGEYHAHYGWALHLCHPDNAQIAEEAIEHVKRSIKLAGDREKPYLLMGRLCKAIGRAGAAEKMFTRAVQIQPDCVEALREIRLINMRRRKSKGLIGRILRR